MTKRLVLVTHVYPAHGGGVEAVAQAIATRLAKNHDVVITWFASDTDEAPSSSSVLPQPVPAWLGLERWFGILYPLWSPTSLFALSREIRRSDAVHIHEAQYLSSMAAALLAFFFRKRLVVTQHVGWIPYRSRFARAMLAVVNRAAARLILRRAHAVLFVSPVVKKYFERLVARNRHFRFVPNGVDTNVHQLRDGHERLQLDRLPNLLFVGRLVERKGLDVIRQIAERKPEWTFTLAGRGDVNPMDWGLKNVFVLGHVDHEQIIELYGRVHLLVLPSVGEGFPLVVQEAMSCGVMCAIDTEIAESGLIPFNLALIEPARLHDSSVRYIRRIEGWLRTPLETRIAQASQIRSFALQQWSWDTTAAEVGAELFSCKNEHSP